MSEHREEQEMEAEALQAIFDQAFEVLCGEQPFKWAVKLLPVDCGGDEDEEDAQNFVGIRLIATIPLEYPETLPDLDIELVKGLGDEHRLQLLDLAMEESRNNEGMPAIFTICEVLREWLADNNVKGLDDASMHAQMMRRAKEDEQKKKLSEREFEAQKKEDEISQAEAEEQLVRKRRTEGTPCTKENFDAWHAAFEQEMSEKAAEEEAQADVGKKQKAEKKEDKSGRITGFMHFSGKGGKNLEEMEKAADELDIDEDLFDVEDDDDLDDLDFEDDEEEEEGDDDEPDI